MRKKAQYTQQKVFFFSINLNFLQLALKYQFWINRREQRVQQ
jgi:hypothetical protein